MRSRERQSTTNDMSTADLKGLLAAPDAKVPDDERDDLHRRGRRRLGHLGWAGVAAGGVAGVAGIVWGISHAGGETKSVVPEPNPTTATGSAKAGETVVSTPEQQERADLFYHVSPDYFIDQAFYDQFEGVDTSGPYGFSDVSPYVNEEALGNTLQNLLDNEVYVYETGDKDGLLATFKQLPTGEFAGNGTAESLEDQHEYAASLQEKYPNLPLTSKKLVSIDEIVPNADPNTVSVKFTYLDNMVGDYVSDDTGSHFQTATTENQVIWDLSLDKIEGWSDGGSRVSWVIEKTFLQNSERTTE